MLGFVNVFKPAGPTSVQVGARVRKAFSILGGRKLPVGHIGTLDPMAAGVLPLALGKATRLIPLMEDRRKSYVFTLVLGRTTATGDATGETVRETAIPPDAERLLDEAAPNFIGSIEQIPPMYSALHVGGERLYEIARRGETVARAPRKITIYGLTLLGYRDGVARVAAACSEGTYIRTLCEDLGAAIGCAAHMGALLRDASGPFVLYESVFLDDIEAAPEAALIAPERVIPFPTIVLDGRSSSDFRAGRLVPLPTGSAAKHLFVRDSTRTLVGVGEAVGALLAPRKVFV
ncbi:MAG: tRNA pseudouridine(55) synthase TruB [Candidatus Eremiobacteraeota bacterium]|nr:tRNA pseudouridine(55) synthase TruB [Candidatus Eremiobacteraeota bacterium]